VAPGDLSRLVLNGFHFQKGILFVKNNDMHPVKMRARTGRFRFILLQLQSNVILMVFGVYLFCLIVYCINCTACNILKDRKVTAI
jgi:hypothetical protein